MHKIVQLIISVVSFLATTIVLDIIGAYMLEGNSLGEMMFGQFPQNFLGLGMTSYMDNYVLFISTDTLGWFTYICLSSTASLELLGSSLTGLGGGYVLSMVNAGSEADLIAYLFGALKILVPIIITGLVGGLAAGTKRGALTNALGAFLIVGIAGIILNVIHVYMNWVSITWKFVAITNMNPTYGGLLLLFSSDQTMYMLFASIAALIYAFFNGAISGMMSMLIAKKK